MLKQAFLDKILTEESDTFALVGTLFPYPTTWVIAEIFHPPKMSRLESL